MHLGNLLFNNISPKQTFFKNSFWLFLSQGLSRLFKLVLIIISARILNPAGFGTFNYILSIASFFFMAADWGVSSLIIREYQQSEQKEKYIQTGFLFRIISTSLCLVAAFVGIFFFESPEFRINFIILSIYLFIANIKDFFIAFLRAMQKMEKEFIVIFMEGFFVMAFSVFLILIHRNIISLSVGYLLGVLMSFITAALLVKSYKTYLKPQFDKKLFLQIIKDGFPLLLSGVASFLLFSTDQIILGKIRGVTEVGYYSLVTKGISIINLVPLLIMIAIFPYLSAIIKNKEKIKTITNKSLLSLFVLALVVAILVFFLAPLITFFVGKDYEPSIALAQYLIWIILFVFPATYLSYLYLSYNKQSQAFYIVLISGIVNLVLNFILIPKSGIYGAATASIIAQFINFILLLIFSRKLSKESPKSIDINEIPISKSISDSN